MPTRFLQDALQIVTKALPAQNTNHDSDSIEIGEGMFDKLKLRVELPATPDLADGQTITITIQDSADDSTFAAVAQYAAVAVTGAGGTGAAAVNREFPMWDGLRQYVRVNIAASATAGDNTGVSATLAVVH